MKYCSAWSTGWRVAVAVAAADAAAVAVTAAAVVAAAAFVAVVAVVVGGTTRDKWTKWCPPSLGPAGFSKTAHRGRDLYTQKNDRDQ